jgi:hypothetical protein
MRASRITSRRPDSAVSSPRSMRDEQHTALAVARLQEELLYCGPRWYVETAGGVEGDQERRLARQLAWDREALGVAARERAGAAHSPVVSLVVSAQSEGPFRGPSRPSSSRCRFRPLDRVRFGGFFLRPTRWSFDLLATRVSGAGLVPPASPAENP